MTKKHNDKDESYMNVFEGYEYPFPDEFEQFNNLCEIIKENYICVDALDKTKNKFET